MVDIDKCIASYEKHKQLFAAADELGMKWQSLYVELKKAGVSVTGDKSRWGSTKDKLAAIGEGIFSRYVPMAIDNNLQSFQSEIDFSIGGIGVDVKTALPRRADKKFKNLRWAFSLSKQIEFADFYVLMALGEDRSLKSCFLIPGDMINKLSTVSIPTSGKSKWNKFEVAPEDLADFFDALNS